MCLPAEDDPGLSRRSLIGGGMIVSVAALAAHPAFGQIPAPPPPTRVLDDPEIEHGPVTMPHTGGKEIGAFLARPRRAGRFHGVLVIAGNRITEEYIPNTCAALAKAGLVGLAPDVFHPLPPEATAAEFGHYLDSHTELNRLDDIQAGASYLRSQPFVGAGGLGVIGFCRGGREAIMFAARSNEVDAVVAYHPAPVQAADITRLRAPLLIHHGTSDTSVSIDNSRRLLGALRARHSRVSLFEYPGAEHGFLAYTRPFYRPDYAVLSWRRTVDFLSRELRSER
jgi:carboxymethylenebutenolidase